MTEESENLAFQVAHNRYGSYIIPNEFAHRHCPRTLLAGDVWEDETIRFIQQEAEGENVIHAGAFVGDMLPAISAHAAHVWAFEPNMVAHSACAETIEANELPNVTLINCGLGHREEVRPLQTHAGGRVLGGASRFVTSDNPYSRANSQLRTRTRRGDDIIRPEDSVGLIHLDVEGWESYALSGMQRIITDHLPILILETHPKRIWAWLYSLGYEWTHDVGRNHVYSVTP